MNKFAYDPFLIIISSPSGAGKSTLCRMLANNDEKIKISVSATTRKKREGEIEGRDYYFVEESRFEEMVKNGAFLEHARVFDNSYGTPKNMVKDELRNQNCVLFDIDWQGARKIRENFLPAEILSIFILPPSRSELERRLRIRAQDSDEVVKKRMKNVRQEVEHFNEYDFVLINENLEECYKKLLSIITAKKISRQKQKILSDLVFELSNPNN